MKMTVKEQRAKAAEQLARRKDPEPTAEQIEAAAHIMRCFYRLYYLSERVCNLQNNVRLCNISYTEEREKKESRAFERISEMLKPYKAEIQYFGIFPTICELGRTNDLYLIYTYD